MQCHTRCTSPDVFKHFAGLRRVLLEKVLFLTLEHLGALSSCSERRVIGDVAEQIEGIGVGLCCGRGEFVEDNAALFQDAMMAARSSASLHFDREIHRGRIDAPHFLTGIVGEFLHAELFAIRVEFVDEVCHDFHPTIIYIVFARLSRLCLCFCESGSVPSPRWLRLPCRSRRSFTCSPIVHFCFRDLSRIAVEIRVSEEPRCASGVVENVEIELSVIVPDARASSDDLLNSVMELITRTNTIFLQVCASSPVVNICEVVTMVGSRSQVP